MYSGKFQIEELINSAENIKISAEQLENSGEQKTIGLTASILKHSIIFWSSKYQEISGNLTNSCSQAGSHKSTFIQQDITYGMNRYLELEKTSTSIIKDFEPIILNSENGVSNWNWWMIAASDAMGAYRWGKVGLVAAGGPAGAIACGFAGAIGHSAISMLVQAATH